MSERNIGAPDSLTVYLDQISQTPLLTPEEEIGLAQVIEAGTAARLAMQVAGREEPTGQEARAMYQATLAKDQFIRANLRLVVTTATDGFSVPSGMELLELIQEGNLGLERAVDKFDWRKGFKFSTYATFWIRRNIIRGIKKHRKIASTLLPLDFSNDDGLSFAEILPQTAEDEPEEATMRIVESTDTRGIIDEVLGERAIRALDLRFGAGRTWEEIGDELGITPSGALRLVNRSKSKLKPVIEGSSLAS